GLYDLIVETDHNTRPRVAGHGSAVFIHVARPGFGPTAGCVALSRSDLQRLVTRLSSKTRIIVHF
ncbi:MAG: L,D-transpeptidase family protein, partial [Rhizobiales bacterium]|nr:L,D-transpeptidase family protein [Hyphomicrobiales bacterium]